MRAFEYWASGEGLGNITPAAKEWPEGNEFPGVLAETVGNRRVLEFGCGLGRLAKVFPADRYVGVDICLKAVLQARRNAPDHEFWQISEKTRLVDADVTLAHTVLLHVPDEYLDLTVNRFCSERVVVSEILGRRWRREGNPPVFNRERAEYESVFRVFGYRLEAVRDLAYPHYRDTDLTLITFVKA